MSTPSSGLIVAAVDESEGSLRALDWAAQEARLWGRKLRVVHVVDHPFRKRASRDAEGGTAESHARQLVHEAVERVRKREPTSKWMLCTWWAPRSHTGPAVRGGAP